MTLKNDIITREIDWVKVALMSLSILLVILIFKSFLIPMALGMINILLELVNLYKLLEMPYLFFGSALFLFIFWYFFTIFCNITCRLIKFVMTNSIHKPESKIQKEKPVQEVREGSYCTQCGKYIPKGEYISRDGVVIYYFFRLFKKYVWEHYFCSLKCGRKFWKDKK